ncbi:MAG: hypothetical protein ACRDQD_30505 [Nocardioidaceae bacterium]
MNRYGAAPKKAPLQAEPSLQTAGVTDRPSGRIAARWRGIPVAGRGLLLLLLVVGLLRGIDALREAWQYRPVEVAQIAVDQRERVLRTDLLRALATDLAMVATLHVAAP